jgi:hypothetical protein
MPVSEYKELPEGHPFKGAHVFFKPKQQTSSQENSTEQNNIQPVESDQSPQANLVRELQDKGIKTQVFSKEGLHKRQNDNLKPGEWPKE